MGSSSLDQYGRTFVVDPAGGVKSEAGGELATAMRAGRWRLFHSSPELALLLREGPIPAVESQREKVVFGGDLGALSPADVAMFLSQTKLTGVLVTRAHGVDRTLSFREGKLAWGSSTEPSERLGEVCARHGLIDTIALRHFMEKVDDPDNRRLGQRLVEARLLNGHELWKAVQLQVSEIFWALLIKSAGAFVFVDAPGDPGLDSHLSLDTQGLLLEGFRRVDELRHFRRRLPSPELMPRRSGPLPLSASLEEQRLYDLADGKRTLVELGIQSRLGEFEATKAVHHLVVERALQVDGASLGERTPGPREAELSITIAAHNEVLAEVCAAILGAGMDAPYRISVDAFLLSEQKATRRFHGLSLEADGTLSEEKLAKLLATPDAAGAVRMLLDAVSSFALFQAREILDEPLAEALSHKARALLS